MSMLLVLLVRWLPSVPLRQSDTVVMSPLRRMNRSLGGRTVVLCSIRPFRIASTLSGLLYHSISIPPLYVVVLMST
jgi:hypothetical protein